MLAATANERAHALIDMYRDNPDQAVRYAAIALQLLPAATGIERGRALIDTYRDNPERALRYAAFALHLLPEQGTYGPAFRDLTKPLVPRALPGAILTDIRDFLKLRFRTEGMKADEIIPSLNTGHFPSGVQRGNPALVVQYVVGALNALSEDREGTINLREACGYLKHLLRETARELARGRYDRSRALVSPETYEVMLEQMYGPEIFDQFDTGESRGE